MKRPVQQLLTKIKKSKRSISVVLGWTATITLIIIATHQSFYITEKAFSTYKIPYLTYKGPIFTDLGNLLLLVAGAIAGILIADVKTMIYGYFAAMFLSFSSALIYVFLYIWYPLELGSVLSEIPFGWELALFMAFGNVFRFLIPFGLVFSLLGLLAGNFLKTLLMP
jgi:hypothetical protein